MLSSKQLQLVLLGLLSLAAIVSSQWTEIHAPGYCAMYPECGYNDHPIYPGKLNCPYNGPAIDPEEFSNTAQFRATLANFCGARFQNIDRVCCDMGILNTVIDNVAISEQFIGGCPACWANFRAFWCEMSCSPDQSMYYNVSKVALDPAGSGKTVVTATEFIVDEAYGTGLYDSCSETKYGASNTLAMTFIGGGAKNYREFLDYLGAPKFMGTPFPINFLHDEEVSPVYTPLSVDYFTCYNDTDYKCACVDCTGSCPVLDPPPVEGEPCKVGSIRCLTFALIMVYAAIILISIPIFIWLSRRSKSASYEAVEPLTREWRLYTLIQKFYYKLGFMVGRFPLTVIFLGAVVVGLCCVGLMNFAVETDPIKLWVGPDSESNLEKNFFDENFGPFYRTQQVIISRNDGGDIYNQDMVSILFDLEKEVNEIVADFKGREVRLDDICFKPLGDYCVVQAVTGFWHNDKTLFETDPDWEGHLRNCLRNPSFPGDGVEMECLPLFGDPLKAEIILGGYPDEEIDLATALVSTYVVQNSLDEEYLEMAVTWEKAYVDFMKEAAPRYPQLRITFYSESAIEAELARESSSDLVIVAISYLVMFVYASIALGKFVSLRRVFIDSKIMLGLAGVFICIFSVLASVGLFSAFGVKTSLIIAEVIPFLVLAVGVDNIFILVHCFEKFDPALPAEQRAAMALSEVGPSITLCALSEAVAFGLGGIVGMPAVYNFAGFSAVAIVIDFLLQVTCFVALLTLDAKRVEAKRIDCAPCFSINAEDPPEFNEGYLDYFFGNYFAPFIMKPIVKLIMLFLFLGLLVVGISSIHLIELGLDQKIALPKDSYLIPYFEDQVELLKVGVPVYFVISDVNVTTLEGQKMMCSSFRDCDEFSISNLIVLESNRPEYSKIALSPALWFDDMVRWLNPSLSNCCRVYRTNPSEFCQLDEPNLNCRTCYNQREYGNFNIGPLGEDYMKHLDFFLQAEPGAECALAGKAAYSTAVVPLYNETTVKTSNLRTYHTVLKTQQDFIDAYDSALRICSDIKARYPSADCFPYSIVYVYFEQYRNIIPVTIFLILIAAAAVFVVNWVILGSFLAALCVIIPVLMIVTNLVGIMGLWSISLNAVSLVNLVMGLGISVEFCSHLTRTFRITEGTRNERALASMKAIGASIFSGITVTKFFGVVVLAFANSEIFVVYYFRMYLAIVFLGFTHGLIFLPIILSFMGPDAVKPVHYDSHSINTRNSSVGGIEKIEELRKQDQRKALYGTIS